jgi:hypothetical protein
MSTCCLPRECVFEFMWKTVEIFTQRPIRIILTRPFDNQKYSKSSLNEAFHWYENVNPHDQRVKAVLCAYNGGLL